MSNYALSKKKVALLEEELSKLLKVTLPQIAKRLQDAREFGDLRENAEYTAARNEQSIAQNRVNEIRNILDNLEGAIYNVYVKYIELNDPTQTIYTVKIVNKYNANPLEGRVSIESPIGKSLWERKKGDVVYVKGEMDNPYKIKIIDIYQKNN